MNRQEIISQIKTKATFLCIGLDPDIQKIPSHLLKGEEPLFAFNKAIIDATHDLCVAYKPNLAFYESCGLEGWKAFEKTVRYIREKDPTQFIIADAKRGDIGNTAEMYARSFYESLPIDAVTLAPYMGKDSVQPFLSYPGKWAILLALTSNRGSADFQMLEDAQGERLFEKVLRRSSDWGDEFSMMYVVGATQGSLLQDVRKLVPRHFLLVPGVGAQGGSLKEVARYAMNDDCGLLVNASRQILYASKDEEFAQAARQEALKLQQEMQTYLKALWG
ncbi:MAG: orotidine-5'-phosphate decarboxylase [Bacteroidales bacterium]|jgi:orotidine-5'-phosphate decarboxylase|nr:orotidine-5'-phosphate decarboxylase [Bacteroidales bacterium]MDI9544264.1 orotidine-5'-phosphate decarboxylase [Bacteroidota bacterium]OQC03608.1 MAG: orotidine 5'-phosphate decarboxylase [Bacteroidetes bacterium ADurb.Bin090]MBP8981775.1 orotidine-5'-phosphate decarboxylase [Bacteroidales bacterium]NLV37938.1 orotidine-5'-phosphate decarboxylase [Bacteroidales bacterium]